ncbi:hypothetical protein NCCP1664_18750 [Zafaria cholistanensis]|uniref:Uncharacterized protein n=1 Tax=Zafaria cholistanensis TaxID=1682741 RepID=A0A5A7NRN5_9MICC|nr:hypothetical protein NCCP1664_18750 [Zafaria cholistanensis]
MAFSVPDLQPGPRVSVERGFRRIRGPEMFERFDRSRSTRQKRRVRSFRGVAGGARRALE